MLIKQFIAKAEVDSDERTVTAIITTSAVDRDHEVLLSKGADLENYLKNPVVLWAHDYSGTPIARTLWMKTGRGKITAKLQFADTDKGEEVYQLFKGGFLNAFSIGFLPKADGSHHPTPKEIERNPEWASVYRVYDKWELLEFSAVPVPANPEALATAVKAKELTLTIETQEELGMEEEKVYTTVNTTDKTNEEKEEDPNPAIIKTDPVIKTAAIIDTTRHIVTVKRKINPKKFAKEIVCCIKGRMYC